MKAFVAGVLSMTLMGGAGSLFALAGNKSPRVGEAAPALLLSATAQGPDASEISWEKLKGKVVVLEFWGMGCGPCRKAIPHWNELVDAFAGKPVVFLSISDDNMDELKVFLKQTPIHGWLALDQPFSPTRAAFDVEGIPHTVMVDATGHIAAITHPAGLKAENIVDVLAGKPSTLPTFTPYADRPDDSLAVTNLEPTKVAVSISGPVELDSSHGGAFDMRGWRKPGYQFTAEKAPLADAMTYLFDICPLLVTKRGNVPSGYYNIKAEAPSNQLAEMRAAVITSVKEKLGVTVTTNLEAVSVYVMTVWETNAPCLQPTDKGGGGGDRLGGFYMQGCEMKGIASFLEGALNKPVIDKTGLGGRWKVDFTWPMSPAELICNSVPRRFYGLLDEPPEKIDLEHMPPELVQALTSEELATLKGELAKPVDARFRPDPANVISAAREKLGLKLELTTQTLPTLALEGP